MNYCFFYQTDFGKIGIAENGAAITQLYFAGESMPGDSIEQETALLKEAGSQLQKYLAGKLRTFSLPLAPIGALYMRRVWESLCAIPYGQTRSYRQIAEELGNPKAARAVGLANNKNPIPIFIPCHRVIGGERKTCRVPGRAPFQGNSSGTGTAACGSLSIVRLN